MKKQKPPTYTLIIVLCFTILGAYVGFRCSKVAYYYPEPFTPKIHSVGETQQELCDAGYPVKVDYKWGPETEDAYCDYMADLCWPKE